MASKRTSASPATSPTTTSGGSRGPSDISVNLRFPTVGETSGAVCRLAGCGLPVVVSDVGWFRELPETFASKIPVGEGEAEAIARELDALASDEVLRKDAVRRGPGLGRGPESGANRAGLRARHPGRRSTAGRRLLALLGRLAGELAAVGVGRERGVRRERSRSRRPPPRGVRTSGGAGSSRLRSPRSSRLRKPEEPRRIGRHVALGRAVRSSPALDQERRRGNPEEILAGRSRASRSRGRGDSSLGPAGPSQVNASRGELDQPLEPPPLGSGGTEPDHLPSS